METIQFKSDEPQISEFKLRQLANLCQYCGVAVKFERSQYCEQCFKLRYISIIERRWRKWGIAA